MKVFLSSTYLDLIERRKAAPLTLRVPSSNPQRLIIQA